MSLLLPLTGFGPTSFLPSQSMQFVAASSQYLMMSNSDFGAYNHAKFTVNFSVRRNSISTYQAIFFQGDGTNDAILIRFEADNTFNFTVYTTALNASHGELITNAIYTDTTNFYDITCQFDSANAVANDRMRVWINQSEIVSFASRINPTTAAYATTAPWYVGRESGGSYGNFMLYQNSLYSGVNPAQAALYTSGLPNSATSISGAWSVLGVEGGNVTRDSIIVIPWTNGNVVTASNIIPV